MLTKKKKSMFSIKQNMFVDDRKPFRNLYLSFESVRKDFYMVMCGINTIGYETDPEF